MKKQSLIGLSLCLLSLPALAAEPAKPAPVPATLAGEVVSVDGIVFIRPDGREPAAGLKPAKPGDLLKSGDIINTSSNGKVKLLMKDKTIVDLGASALFKVDNYKPQGGADRQVDVSMMYGTMRAAVPQKITGSGRFKVRTPTATMGVRGTEFVIKSEMRSLAEMSQAAKGKIIADPAGPGGPGAPKAATEITVLQGKVEVAKPDVAGAKPGVSVPPPIALTAGMQVSTQGEQALSKPVTLDKAQLTQLTQVAKVQDNTFTKAVIIDLGPQNNNGGGASDQRGGGDRSPASNGSSGGSPTGEMTRKIIENFVAAAPPPPINVNVFPGAPDIHNIVNAGPANPLAGMRRLRVIVNVAQ